MADYGIKVSEAGHDIATAEDINLCLKSDFRLLKVSASGNLNLSAGWNNIAHGLGYAPQFLVFLNATAGSYMGVGEYNYLAKATATNVSIYKPGDASTAYYYIFYEQL